MKAKIKQVGNSLGIILPKGMLNLLSLTAGDEIELSAKEKQIKLILTRAKK